MHNLPALPDLKLFCVVLRHGSLAAAAAELGASPSFVSKRVAVLEAALGVRLLHRTTRRIAVTDEGEAVHRWALRILADVDDMAQELSTSGRAARSRSASARVPASAAVTSPPLSPSFALRYPEVEVRLEVLDRPVDPVARGSTSTSGSAACASRTFMPSASRTTDACSARRRAISRATASLPRWPSWRSTAAW